VGLANGSTPKSAKRSNFVGTEDCTAGGATVPGGTAAVGGATAAVGGATAARVTKLVETDVVTDGR